MRIYVELLPSRNKEDVLMQCLCYDNWKSKILLTLKDLQEEIENDNDNTGVILISGIDDKFEINVRGFDKDLGRKIYSTLLPLKSNKVISIL